MYNYNMLLTCPKIKISENNVWNVQDNDMIPLNLISLVIDLFTPIQNAGLNKIYFKLNSTVEYIGKLKS